MTEHTFPAPHHVTVGYLGQPGQRTFIIQFEDDEQRLSLVAEKGQIDGLGELLAQVLAQIDQTPATDWDREAMALREPVEPAWRVGEIGVGMDLPQGRVLIELSELVPDDADPDVVRVSIDPDQARRLAAHAEQIVGEGRPVCQLCGRPTDPDGSHVCPASNGHGVLSR